MSDLVRFSVTMPSDLVEALGEYTKRRGTSRNRSEVIRDLVRDALVAETVGSPDSLVFGTLTMVFNHHARDLRDKLDDIQHDHIDEIVSTMHVHVDVENCLEIIVMRGLSRDVRDITDALLGTKGVLNGHLSVTTVESTAHEPKRS